MGLHNTMQPKDFSEVLRKYLDNTCTPEEKKLVEEWFESIRVPQHEPLSKDQELEIFQLYKRDLLNAHIKQEKKAFSLPLYQTVWFKIAAVVLIAVTSLLYVFTVHINKEPNSQIVSGDPASTLQTISNRERSAIAVALDDGSEVILNPGATLSFERPFPNGIREVKLEGEAFFDVAKDSLKPFIVSTARLTTRVLGTSFSVEANVDDEVVTVSVKTGKVLLHPVSSNEGQSIRDEVLIRDQQGVYNAKEGTFEKKQVEVPQPLQKSMQRLRFNEKPVSEILHALERTHQTKIVFDETNFRRCLLSTSILPDENIFRRLDIICKSVGASYEVNGLLIVVTGKPCQ